MNPPTSARIGSLAVSFLMWQAAADLSRAQSGYEIPTACSDAAASEVTLVDCLETHQEILQHIIDYETLMLEAAALRTQRPGPPPHTERQPASAPSSPSENEAWDSAMERVGWFDQNLEIYAIVGDDGSRTAHARLAGREYRLRIGDQVRLATVTAIGPRAVRLSIPGGVEFTIGLSGSAAASLQSGIPQ